MIELDGVWKEYAGNPVVQDLSLRVEQGELVVLLGSSGCGKTTTLKMVNRLVEPSRGCIRIAGEDNRASEPHLLRRRIGYAFQRIGLFPHLDVAGNVSITPTLLGWDRRRIEARVDQLLELVKLDPGEFRSRRPHQLSGGQQQRVGLARALAAEPEVLLLDEPFGALDPLTRDHLQQELLRIRRELGLTLLFVTHDMLEALLLGDRIAVMAAGRLVQIGRPSELLRSPAATVVSDLMDAPRRQARVLERHLAGSDATEIGG